MQLQLDHHVATALRRVLPKVAERRFQLKGICVDHMDEAIVRAVASDGFSLLCAERGNPPRKELPRGYVNEHALKPPGGWKRGYEPPVALEDEAIALFPPQPYKHLIPKEKTLKHKRVFRTSDVIGGLSRMLKCGAKGETVTCSPSFLAGVHINAAFALRTVRGFGETFERAVYPMSAGGESMMLVLRGRLAGNHDWTLTGLVMGIRQ